MDRKAETGTGNRESAVKELLEDHRGPAYNRSTTGIPKSSTRPRKKPDDGVGNSEAALYNTVGTARKFHLFYMLPSREVTLPLPEVARVLPHDRAEVPDSIDQEVGVLLVG